MRRRAGACPALSSFYILPSPPWGSGAGGEGINALKPQTTQRCPQVFREGAGRRVVVAQCFQRRDVNCKDGRRPTTPSPGPPRLERTPVAVHAL